jgi:hypothetical protein
MSFKIFTLQLTGKLKDTGKIEAQRAALEKNYKAFLEAEGSARLEEYRELETWVNSGAMQISKKELESQVFKGSQEHNQLIEFEALKKAKAIRNYFKVEGSQDLSRFKKIKDSAKLQEYYELKDYVEGGHFQQEKREIMANKYAGSVEERHINDLTRLKKDKAFRDYLSLLNSSALDRHRKFSESAKLRRFLELKNMPAKEKEARKEFKQLKNDPEIKAYFRLENSKTLKNYREISGSHIPEHYQELLKETEASEFRKKVAYLQDKKKLEKSEAWGKFVKFKNLGGDPDIRFYLKFEKSPLYINYLDTKESFALQRYNELLAITISPEFLKRKAWLEDAKKWEKSEEYVKHQRYLELKKDPQVVLYYKYVNSREFDFFRTWEISFADDFESKSLDAEKWTPNSLWADRLLGDNFSQPGDLQAYTGGKNCTLSHSKLHINIKKEKFRSKHWQPAVGFVPADYNYSSDTLSTIKSFWQDGGIFEAKIFFNPVKEVVSTCNLQGEKNSPMISLVEMGPKPRLGVLMMNGKAKPDFSGIELNHLKTNKFYIFSLEWDRSQLIWKINNAVVHQMSFPGLDGPAHLNFTSLVIDEISPSKLPVSFEIDWVKCFRKR